ncbi:MAG: hypothetical protein J5819_07050 [Eubacterium sp.]|nr:hypothetical protein [Eubacterium sp.]
MNDSGYSRNARLIQIKYREYLIPSVLTSAALACASVVDSAIVGNLLGERELAAIGACSPIIALVNALFMIFNIGGSTKASVAMGEHDRESADRYYSVDIIVGLLVSAVFIVGMLIAAKPITYMLSGSDEKLASLVIMYFRPVPFLLPALFLTLGMAQFMKIDGKPKMASYIALVSNAINLVLDYVLIKFVGLGLTGASLSTLLGYVFGIALVLPWFLSKDKSFHFVNPFKGKFFSCLKTVLVGGSSRFFYHVSDFFKRIILNAIVLYCLGSPGLSVLTVCNSLLFFSTSITNGGADAFLPIVGSLHGEKDHYGIRQCMRVALIFVISGCVILMAVMVIAPGFIAGLFGLEGGETEEIARFAIRVLAFAIPVMGIKTNLQNLYNTTGRSVLASAMSILSGIAYLCLFAFGLSAISPNLFWLAFVCSEALTLLTVWVIGIIIKKKEHTQGYLLLQPPDPDTRMVSFTLEADAESAVGLSEKVRQGAMKILDDTNLANRLAMAIEEMTVAVAGNAKGNKKPLIDITITKTDEQVSISFRDNSKPNNLLTLDTEDTTDSALSAEGMEVFKKIAKSTAYSRQLGFNSILAKF